jgi:hypothetical protein
VFYLSRNVSRDEVLSEKKSTIGRAARISIIVGEPEVEVGRDGLTADGHLTIRIRVPRVNARVFIFVNVLHEPRVILYILVFDRLIRAEVGGEDPVALRVERGRLVRARAGRFPCVADLTCVFCRDMFTSGE